MKRRQFIRTGINLGIVLGSLKAMGMSNWLQNSYDELIGKGTPDLAGNDIKFRKEVFEAYGAMCELAEKDGITIKAVSAYRTFERQKQIWEGKYRAYTANGMSPTDSINRIIRYSTIPGTSRHHWGTDLDIIEGSRMHEVTSLLSPSNFEKGRPFYDLGQWLKEHAATYGFYLVYTNLPGRKGFNYEPWHFSYKPLSLTYLEQFLELDLIKILQREDFAGSEFFDDAFINTYIQEHILDINPVLLGL